MSDMSCTVSVSNHLDELGRLYGALEPFADRAALTPERRHALLLITEELFANIVRYGYAEGDDDTIEVTVALRQDTMCLTMRDQSRPFDFAAPPKRPNEGEGLADKQIGGLGLFLIHEYSQSIAQHRDGTVNVTEVILK